MIHALKSRWTIGVVVALCVILVALLDMAMSVTPFTDDETKQMESVLLANGIPTRGVRFKWLHGWRANYGVERGLCASYRCFSHTVVIPRQYKDIAFDPVLLPTIAHELTHAGQCKRDGLFTYNFYKIFKRHLLESEAENEEMRILETLTEGHDAIN